MVIFPNDANGDALCRMQDEGDDLTKPRSIDFNVVFADENSAEEFAQHFRALGHEVSVGGRGNETRLLMGCSRR